MADLITLVRYNLRFKASDNPDWGYMVVHSIKEMKEVGTDLLRMGLHVEIGNYLLPVRKAGS